MMDTVYVHPGKAVRRLKRRGYRVHGMVVLLGQRPLVVMSR